MNFDLKFAGVRPLWDSDGSSLQSNLRLKEEAACGMFYLVSGTLSARELTKVFTRSNWRIGIRKGGASYCPDDFRTASGYISY